MTWLDYALAAVAVLSLGFWWDAKKEARGWKKAFCNLYNERVKNDLRR